MKISHLIVGSALVISACAAILTAFSSCGILVSSCGTHKRSELQRLIERPSRTFGEFEPNRVVLEDKDNVIGPFVDFVRFPNERLFALVGVHQFLVASNDRILKRVFMPLHSTRRLAISGGGRYAVYNDTDKILCYDFFESEVKCVYRLSKSPSLDIVLVGLIGDEVLVAAPQGSVAILDVRSGHHHVLLDALTAPWAAASSADCEIVALGGEDSHGHPRVWIWNVRSRRLVTTISMGTSYDRQVVSSLAVSADKVNFAVGFVNSDKILLCDLRTGNTIKEGVNNWEANGNVNTRSIVFLDSRHLAVTAGKLIRVFGVKSMEEVRSWRGHTYLVRKLVVSADLRALFSTDGLDVRQWNVNDILSGRRIKNQAPPF